ncbi:DNA polymerase delta subunit 2 [Blyttiomyces sp. JEL0837]|nr:DNA polymerase delta subunit 2 [Blyttiomyces sp. JEL0837]
MIRTAPSYENHSDQFLVKNRSYTQQFAGLYFTRLNLLRPRVINSAKANWGNRKMATGIVPKHVERILDVCVGDLCYISGTVYVDMPLKPNILDEVSQENWVVAPPPRLKFYSEKDEIYLEDESGRVKVTGPALEKDFIVSGVVLGLLGFENPAGEFEVMEICYPEMKPQLPLPMQVDDSASYLAIVSGFGLGEESALSLELQLCLDFITGEVGEEPDQANAAKIARVIIAGNTFNRKKGTAAEQFVVSRKNPSDSYDLDALVSFDHLIGELCSGIPVDLMPGENDPTTHALPQQPMNVSMFTKSRGFSTLNCVSNPYAFEIGGVSVLGTSGQTIDDIGKYTEIEDRVSLVERTLAWAHLAPTAPDTLWCYPFKDEDPFIIERRPHIYFVGNQPKFETGIVDGPDGSKTRVIMVPAFASSKSIVLVDLATLECKEVVFG